MEPSLENHGWATRESPRCCISNYTDFETCAKVTEKPEITLDLSLGQKDDNIFEANLTPTPTRLIKDCEAVGLFEDLRHVNPFDEGFRRATEQNSGQTPTQSSANIQCTQNDGDSLHTPQVYPIDCAPAAEYCALPKTADNESPLDVPIVEELLTATETANTPAATNGRTQSNTGVAQPILATPAVGAMPIIPSQMITWVIPAQVTALAPEQPKNLNTVIPVQTVRPFILPKPATVTATNKCSTIATKLNLPAHVPTPNHEPSSASLTPTSQLPIKERLKAILNNNNKMRAFENPTKSSPAAINYKHRPQRDNDCMERRRAAATRYRNKMRNEHKDLRLKNAELQAENKNLRQRLKELERELLNARQSSTADSVLETDVGRGQIQIPQSSIHLVINVPKMIVPTKGTAQLQQPITYQLEKK